MSASQLSAAIAIAISFGITNSFQLPVAYAQPFVPPTPTTVAPAAPVSVPVNAPVTVQPVIQTRAPELNLPTFTGNPVLTPADQNIGNTSISLTNRMSGALPGPHGVPILPPFMQQLSAMNHNNLHVEELPTNATIIDTADASDCDHLAPVAMYNALAQSLPLFGSITNVGPLVVRVNDKRSEFFVCTDEGRLIEGDSTSGKDGLIAGAAGTVFSNNSGVLTMHTGRALVQTKQEPIRIATRVGGLKIEKHTTVLIDYSPEKILTIAVLAQGANDGVKVRSKHVPDAIITLNTGERLVAGDAPLMQEPDAEGLASNHAMRMKLEPAQVKSALDELTSPQVIGTKASQRLLNGITKYTRTDGSQKTSNNHKPALRLLSCEGTAFSASKAGEIHVYYGHVFLSLPQNMVVSTNLGDVHCQAGATVNIARLPGHARIQLFDAPTCATIKCGTTTAVLDKGQEVLLSDHYPAQSEALPADGIGRRQFVLNRMDNNITAVLSDFQVFGSIRNSANLEALRHPATEADKQLCTNLLKFTAALQYATVDRGNYYFPPKQGATSAR